MYYYKTCITYTSQFSKHFLFSERTVSKSYAKSVVLRA